MIKSRFFLSSGTGAAYVWRPLPKAKKKLLGSPGLGQTWVADHFNLDLNLESYIHVFFGRL